MIELVLEGFWLVTNSALNMTEVVMMIKSKITSFSKISFAPPLPAFCPSNFVKYQFWYYQRYAWKHRGIKGEWGPSCAKLRPPPFQNSFYDFRWWLSANSWPFLTRPGLKGSGLNLSVDWWFLGSNLRSCCGVMAGQTEVQNSKFLGWLPTAISPSILAQSRRSRMVSASAWFELSKTVLFGFWKLTVEKLWPLV